MSNVQRVETTFNFRTKDGVKRPSVEVAYDVPNKEGVIEYLNSEDPKVSALVLETVQGIVTSYVRSFVDNDTEFDQAKLDELVAKGKISLEIIANLPRSERNTLTKEELDEFAKDYIAAMPEITGKSKEKVTVAAGLFQTRYKSVAGDNSVLAVLQEQLGIFIDKAGDEMLEKHAKALTYLSEKVTELLSVKVTADAL